MKLRLNELFKGIVFVFFLIPGDKSTRFLKQVSDILNGFTVLHSSGKLWSDTSPFLSPPQASDLCSLSPVPQGHSPEGVNQMEKL